MNFGKDHRTYDMALAILHEEVEHDCLIEIGRHKAAHVVAFAKLARVEDVPPRVNQVP
jgi:hypothetical protein